MAASLVATNPGEIPFELTVTFTLDQWKEIRKLLMDSPSFSYPANELTNVIRDVINKAEKTYYAEDKKS